MKAIWERQSATANEVVESLAEHSDWKPKTIMTMLKRLVDKGVLSYEKQGRAFRYFPLIDESHCLAAEGRSFLRRVYNGSLVPIMASFVSEVDLSEAEIRELKEILADKKRKLKAND